MKKGIVIMILALSIILQLSQIYANEFPDYYSKTVNDFAKILDSNQTSYLENILSTIESETTAEVTIATLNTTSPYSPKEYRTKLFNYWHIGKADKNNGLLILYSVKENRIEVETGYGLEGILPDSKIGRLLDEYYVPKRDKGNVVQGIISFTEQISKTILENKEEIILSKSEGNNSNEVIWFIGILIGLMGFLALLFYLSKKMSNNFKNRFKSFNKNLAKFKNIKLKSTSKTEETNELKKIQNLKMSMVQKTLGIIVMIIFFSFFILPFIFMSEKSYIFIFGLFIGLFILLLILTTILSKIPYKCQVCKEKMVFKKKINNYSIYECSNGHKGKVYISSSSGSSHSGSSFRGSSCGSGSGSFGGGSSGGGGAGR